MGIVRQERVGEDGFLRCEHCGKPIVRAYDCIGHHTIPLTEQNVNDYSISLNPNRIMLVHHKCHNTLHNKLGHIARTVYLVYGPPLSGKSSWVASVQEPGDLVVDMDRVWQCVSGCERYVKPGRLNAVAFDLHRKLLDYVRMRTGRWLRAYVIGGYPLSGERERLCKSLGAREIFIDTPEAVCRQRLESSDDGRDLEAWGEYIER